MLLTCFHSRHALTAKSTDLVDKALASTALEQSTMASGSAVIMVTAAGLGRTLRQYR